MQKVALFLKARYISQPGAFVHTYGCQQNVSDSERLKGMLTAMGYRMLDSAEQADLVLFNTCAVREHAQDRVLGNVGALKELKRRRPSAVICVVGCMVQQETVVAQLKKSYPYVDLVLGTNALYHLPEHLYEKLTGQKRIFDIDASEALYEQVPLLRDGSFKGWLPIMYGCNNFCTYCIVPYVRGRERSRQPEDILQEAKDMIAAGFKDITLLGQNVNSYGKGEAHGVNFARLLRMLNDLPGDFRLRFMTSHPKDCTLELLDAMRDCKKAAHHLHLPFQSGSDRILREMNRHYDRAKYLELVAAARERVPDIALTSDVIVGFPGETRADFEETLRLVEEVGFTSLFTFIYSPRTGTPAAAMEDPIPLETKKAWLAELLDTQERMAAKGSQGLRHKVCRVLVEEPGRAPGTLNARTSGNAVVEFPGEPSLIGTFQRVEITEPGVWAHKGQLV